MKYVSFLFALGITVALGILVSMPFGQVPPLAPLLDPNHGFWQNSFSEDQMAEDELELNNLSDEVQVTRSRKGWMLMNGKIEDFVRFVKDVRCAIAVMPVKIDD